MYAMVFGESVLNDAVAIVLSRYRVLYCHYFNWCANSNCRFISISAVQTYGSTFSSSDSGFQVSPFFQSLGVFVYTFASSFVIGATMGCATALLTKFTHIRDFPLLETALFFMMSYSTFLIAEAADLTGNVSFRTFFYA